MQELQERAAQVAADWQSVLTDVDYALRQLRRCSVLSDEWTRAADALERVRETAHRNVTGEG